MAETAASMVSRILTDVLPPGVPPSFKRVSSAQFVGSGRARKAVGMLEMFDGQSANVEVFKAGEAFGIPMWGHRWTSLPGGSVSYEGGKWIRINPDTLEPYSEQGMLNLAVPAAA